MPRCRRLSPVRAGTIKNAATGVEAVTTLFHAAAETILYRRAPTRLTPPFIFATGIVTDRRTRHRTRPEHDACAGNAPSGISLVCAVHDRLSWRGIESDTCKPQQGASSDLGNCR